MKKAGPAKKKSKKAAPLPKIPADLLDTAYEDVVELQGDYKGNTEAVDLLTEAPPNLFDDFLETNAVTESLRISKSLPNQQLTPPRSPASSISPPAAPGKSKLSLKKRAVEPERKKKSSADLESALLEQATRSKAIGLGDFMMHQLQPQEHLLTPLEPEPNLVLVRDHMDFVDVTKLALEIRENTKMDFSGVQTTTDAVMYALSRTGNKLELDLVIGLNLTGCNLLTDYGVSIAAGMFPNLKSIDISGCPLVTESALSAVSKKCALLKSLKLTGSGVRVVPPKLIPLLEGSVEGCPLVSPVGSLLKAKIEGTNTKGIPMKRVDCMKVVIVRQGGTKTNLLRSIRKEAQNGETVSCDSSYKIGSTLYPMVETDAAYIDMFATKRTIYVITSEVNNEKKLPEEADRILAIVSQIFAKVGDKARFVLATIDTEKEKSVSVSSLCSKVKENLKKLVNTLKDAFKMLKMSVETKEDLEEMRHQGFSAHLKHCLEKFDPQTCQLKVSANGMSDSDKNVFNNCLMKQAEAIDGLCGEYQTLVDSPDMKELLSTKMADTFKTGLCDLEDAKKQLKGLAMFKSNPNLVKPSLGILAMMGKVCQMEVNNSMYVTSVEMMCDMINAVTSSPPEGSTSRSGSFACVSDNTQIWSLRDFRKMLAEKLKVRDDQVATVMAGLKDLNLVYSSKWVVNIAHLEKEPPISLTKYYQNSSDKHCLKVTGEVTLHHILPSSIFSQFLMTVLKLNPPIMLWASGVVVHDGIAEVLIQRVGKKVELRVDCIQSLQERSSLDMVWYTFMQYQGILTHLLDQACLLYKTSTSGSKPNPYKSSVVLQGHSFTSQKDSGSETCTHCGMDKALTQVVKSAQVNNGLTILTEKNIKLKQGKINGTAISLQAAGSAELTATLDLQDNPLVTFTLMETITESVSVTFSGINSPNTLTFDLHKGIGKSLIGRKQNTMKFSPVSIPGLPVTFTLVPAKVVEDKVKPKVYEGMRLEALDRLNPSLVAVATIEQIDKKGRWLIHFDGWTNKYDYWTEPESNDLHPLGYMEHVGHTKQALNPSLQPPNNYAGKWGWMKYLKELDADPVPWEVFTDKQKEGTPADETKKASSIVPEDLMAVEVKVGDKVEGQLVFPHVPVKVKVINDLSSDCRFTVSNMMQPTSNTSVVPGMRLEALDRLNPSLIAVATIEKFDENGRWYIHFDGWTSKYDFWAEPDSLDLHPLGYMKHIGHTKSKYNPRLQEPKNYGKSFDWAKYLQDTDVDPVPWEAFTDEQTEGTPPDETQRAMESSSGGSGARNLRCRVMVNRGAVINQQVRSLLQDMPSDISQELSEFLTRNQRLFCVLPKSLDIDSVRFPSTSAIADHTAQAVYFLCHSDKFDVHMLNHPGLEFPGLASYDKVESVLFFSCLVMLLQEHMIPMSPLSLCAGLDKSPQDQEVIDMAFTRLIRLYLKMFWFIGRRQAFRIPKKLQRKTTDSSHLVLESSQAIALNSLLTTARGQDSFSVLVSGQGNLEHVICKPHELAIAPNSEISTLDTAAFTNSAHLIIKLDVKQNRIKELPVDIFTFFLNLTSLNVSKNEIMTLPSLAGCQNLTYIDVSYNKLTTLPDGFAKVKENLTYLNISHNPLWTLPRDVLECKNLTELHADNIGKVQDMAAICSNMPDLEKLSLNYNIVEKLPDKLPAQLKLLGLAGLPIIEPLSSTKTNFTMTSFETFLNENVALSKMSEKEKKTLFELGDSGHTGSLSREGISAVNTELLNNETYKRFGIRRDTKEHEVMPVFLTTCPTLEHLDVSNHCFQRVEDSVKDLTKLESLNLSNSLSLLSLSAEITSVPIKELHLKNCPLLKTPPKEIVARGFKAIYGYLRRLRLGSVDCKRTKLMFVGLGGAGKTSLVRVLTKLGFSYYHDYGEQITDGIDITRWDVPVEGSDEPISYSTWDFAGQTVYYNTHQFFLSNRAVYLLLWNIRLGYEHAGLDFWLSSIACHAPKAPILIIGTHCDKVEKPRMPTDDLKRRYPQICGFYAVSSYTGDGIEAMKKDLINVTLEQKYMGEKIPEAWLNLEKVLIKEKSKDLMPWKDVRKCGEPCGIMDDTELTQAIQFLHDLGSVQFFNTPFLRTYVVIRPQWIVDVMACVVTVHEGPIKNGRLKHTDMKKVWSDYPSDLHPWLLRLTEEFDLTCPLKDEEANIVPCLLPTIEPKYDWPAITKMTRETKMMYKFDYLPAGLFNRAQVRLHQLTDGSVMWKKGSLLKKNHHTAVILQISATNVLVKVQGYKPENILFLVHEVFECLICESYSGVQYDFFIPCLECQSAHLVEPCMFPASKVHRALEMKAPFLQCDKAFHIMSIPELQAIMPPDKTSDFDDHLGRTVRELKDLENTSVSVFFCYSTKNVPSLAQENKLVHPGTIIEDLRKANHKVSFCDTPETTDMETLTLSMKAAQVVLIGMSDEFIETEQCRNLIVYCQETLKKPVLLAVLGAGTKWLDSNLKLVLGDHVYVKIYQAERYDHKIKELIEAIKVKAGLLQKAVDLPSCFISYCWSNSHEAVRMGSQGKAGSLGWGDPRRMKKFFESKGIKCWLDIERVGQTGFFEDIADGLRKCKVMVACVSDQYAESRNCLMEFRFAIATLKIPVILAVVGTGYMWERSEIGLIAVGQECVKVNLQYENEAGLLELFDHVKKVLPVGTEDSNVVTSDDQRQSSFQEVLELAERKFLRQIAQYAESIEGDGFPRVVLVDIQEKPELTEEEKKALSGDTTEEKEDFAKKWAEGEGKNMTEEQREEAMNKLFKEKEKVAAELRKQATAKLEASKYCFRVLCEHEQGWHPVANTIPFPALNTVGEESYLQKFAGYLVRIHTLLKHTGLNLNLLNTTEGERLRANLEEWCQKGSADFQDEYKILLQEVIEQDKEGTKCGLTRCHMPNGKTLWLCKEHEQQAYSSTAHKYKQELDKRQADKEDTPGGDAQDDKQVEDDDDDKDEDSEDEEEEETVAALKPLPVKKSLKRQKSQACSVM